MWRGFIRHLVNKFNLSKELSTQLNEVDEDNYQEVQDMIIRELPDRPITVRKLHESFMNDIRKGGPSARNATRALESVQEENRDE